MMFEDFLQEKHIEERPQVLDDELPDDFNDWLCQLDVDQIIEWADEFARNKQNYGQANTPESKNLPLG